MKVIYVLLIWTAIWWLVFAALTLITGCAFDPLGTTYHETAANKMLRLQNEQTMVEYWQTHRTPP